MTDWAKLGKKLAAFAPAVGAAVGGPGGAVVGALVASRLGVNATPQAIAKALQDDPDAPQTVAGLTADPAILSAMVELAKVQTADVQDARTQHKDNLVPAILAFSFVAVFAIVLFLPAIGSLFGVSIPAISERQSATLENILFLIVGFYYGSNIASARKTELLAEKK